MTVRSPHWRWIPFAGIFILLGLLLCHSWSDPDVWYHLTWGRSLVTRLSFLPVTKTLLVQPIGTNVYWLFQILLYGVYQLGGIYLVSSSFLILWFAIALIWIYQTRAYHHAFFGSFAFLGFVICVQPRFEARPEILSYLFLSGILLLITRIDFNSKISPKKLAGICLMQILWTNCHGYAALGPMLGIALIAGHLWDRRRYSSAAYQRMMALFALLLTCTFVSPFGWGLWTTVADLVSVSRGLRNINAELMPLTSFSLFWPLPVFWLFWGITTISSLINLAKRRSSFASILALAGSLLALQAIRNSPLYLLLSAPLLEQALRRGRGVLATGPLPFAAPALALVLSFFVCNGDYFKYIRSLSTFGVHEEWSAYPIGAAHFLRDIHFDGNIFSDSYDGGYLEYHLPEIKIFGDSYFSDAPATLSFFKAIKDFRNFQDFDRNYHFDALLLNIENQDFLRVLLSQTDWKLVYADSHRLLFLRGAGYENIKFDLDKSSFYHGDDLSHWTYEFGVMAWLQLAIEKRDIVLIKKLVHDVSPAPEIPGNFVRYALIAAMKSGDKGLLNETLKISNKLYIASAIDAPAIARTISQAEAIK